MVRSRPPGSALYVVEGTAARTLVVREGTPPPRSSSRL